MPSPHPATTPAKPPRAETTRPIVEPTTGDTVDAPVYARDTLTPGTTFPGPAAITEPGTTTIVPTGCTAHIAHGGEIIIDGAPA
jgi:N-methylhydantoinase A